MPTLSKPKKAKSGKTKGSALDSAQRELLEQQAQIQAQIEAIQRSLEQVPTRGNGPARRERETIPTSAPRGRYVHGATVMDARRVTVVPAEPVRRRTPKRPTMLRAERIAARRQTMALAVCLVGAVIYALSHLLPLSF